MMKRTALAGVMAMTVLAACSKSTPPEAPADAAATPPAKAAPTIDRAKMAAGLIDLLDTAPQCQSFRDRLEEAGRTPADVPLDVEMMNQVVADAHAAGCSKKSAQQ
jgi:hypothetical protein